MSDFRSTLKTVLHPLRMLTGKFSHPYQTNVGSIINKTAELIGSEKIEGDYLEFGVFRGNSVIDAYHTIGRAFGARTRDRESLHSDAYRGGITRLWDQMRFFAFDSFQGLPELTGIDAASNEFEEGKFACSVEEFNANLRAAKVDLRKVVVVPGWFDETCRPETIARHNMRHAAIVHIDCDLYESARVVLKFIEPLLVDGTIIIFDDWYAYRGNPGMGEQRAFREWTATMPEWTFTEYQKEGPWRNSFIANKKM